MQYNAMQCNTMQYNNTMQCNAMQCNMRKSVRPYGMKSVSHFFFFFFFIVSMYGVRQYVRNTNVRMDRQEVSVFSCQYVRMYGWTDRVSVISVQFQFSRIQSSKSVRPYGGPNQKKKKKNEEKKGLMSVCTNVTNGRTSFQLFQFELLQFESHTMLNA
jgi:hypothetical protein